MRYFLTLSFVLLGLDVAHASTRDTMLALIAGHHAVAPEAIKALNAEHMDVLRDIARDKTLKAFTRGRALSLLGAKPDEQIEQLWKEARAWPELELNIQAAYAQALARSRDLERLKSFLLTLLANDEPRIREVGIQCLFALRIADGADIAKAHLANEQDATNRAVIQQRLSAI